MEIARHARGCAALIVTALMMAGCANLRPIPDRATVLGKDEMIVFGRVQVVENGQLQTAASDKELRPQVCFRSRDRSWPPSGPPEGKKILDDGCVQTDADGYFFTVGPALPLRLTLFLRSQFTEYKEGNQFFAVHPGVELPAAVPGEAHYIGTLQIEGQISGRKGHSLIGPKVCRLVNVGIIDESAVAESEFRRRFPLDAHLLTSKMLLERNSNLPQGLFYGGSSKPSGGDSVPYDPLIAPLVVPLAVVAVITALVMAPAAYDEYQSVWKGPDQECYLYIARSLWPEAEAKE